MLLRKRVSVTNDDDDRPPVQQHPLTTVAKDSELFGSLVEGFERLLSMELQPPVEHQRQRR
jgi:hypothetical protein